MRDKPYLFEKFPGLENKIPWLKLGDFPTPVVRLERLGQTLKISGLYCKRDDLSHPEYGGNKIRKLEFLLADARRFSRQSVLTLGAWGSNHVLATTVMAGRLGIKPLAVLIPQPAQEYARQNLLTNYALGCELNYAPGTLSLPLQLARVYFRHWLKGERPYLIWAGGSSPLGTLGYVEAGLEIAGQIEQGVMPEPDYIFCAVGSSGTFVGLVLGLKLAGRKTRVLGVRVFDKSMANSFIALRLARACLKLLRKHDPSIPALNLTATDFPVLHDYAGSRYAVFTKAGMEALRLAKDLEGLKLDGTYTGKTFSAIIRMSVRGELQDKVVLFLNSYNSRPIDKLVKTYPDWKELPAEFHHCFMEKIPEPEE